MREVHGLLENKLDWRLPQNLSHKIGHLEDMMLAGDSLYLQNENILWNEVCKGLIIHVL